MKKIGILIFSFLFISIVHAESYEVFFSQCVDGDTAFFSTDGINDEKYRFLAIDAPEIEKTDDNYGHSASKYVCEELKKAKSIIIEEDEIAKTDKYNRKLGWIWVDGKLLQKKVIDKGYAKVAYIYDDYKYVKSLCYYEKKVFNKKIGIWSNEQDLGYCSTIEVSKKDLNIDYEMINEKATKNNKNNKKTYDRLKKTSETLEKASDYADKNASKITKFLLYGIIVIAIIYLLRKNIRSK